MGETPDPERILLIRLSAIGDVVHALHALAALRATRPDAFIGFLVEDRVASLLADHPDIDRLHVFPRKSWRRGLFRRPGRVGREVREFVTGLREERYDVAVDFQSNLKGGVLTRLSGATRRVGLARGYGKEMNHRFQTEWVTPPPHPFHRVDRGLLLLSPLGVTGPAGTPRVHVHEEDKAEIEKWLAEANLSPGRYTVFHPGTSSFGAHKRWPTHEYGALAARLGRERGLTTVVTWGPGEEAMAMEVVDASEGHAVFAPPTNRLTALAWLAAQSALFVAGDTGALHLAALLGAPTIGLFGPKDPRVYGPRGPKTAVVWKGVDCSNCPKRSCPDPVCMTSITTDDVTSAVDELLERN